MGVWIAIGAVVVIGIYFVGIFNGLIRRRNETENAWAQIDVQLKRRHDLIPNLIEAVKGYMQHEKSTLEAVVQARTAAASAKGPVEAGAAEGLLGALLGRVFMLAEDYPELKANTNFLSLQEELTSTENRIAFARQAYNDAATRYNNAREVFPAVLISGGFERAEPFEIQKPSERELPKADFGDEG